MSSLAQRLAQPMATLRAILRGIGRVDGHHRPTSFCRFVGQDRPKRRPGRIVNGCSKAMIVHHAIDRKVFHGDQSIVIDQPTSQLMREVMPLEPQYAHAPGRPPGAPGLVPASLCRRPTAYVVPWPTPFLPGGKKRGFGICWPSDKVANFASPTSRTGGLRACWQRRHRYGTDESSPPLAGRTAADRAGLRAAFQGSVWTHLDQAHLAQTKGPLFERKAGRLRVGQAIVAALALVARKARVFTRLAATEEGLERQIDADPALYRRRTDAAQHHKRRSHATRRNYTPADPRQPTEGSSSQGVTQRRFLLASYPVGTLHAYSAIDVKGPALSKVRAVLIPALRAGCLIPKCSTVKEQLLDDARPHPMDNSYN